MPFEICHITTVHPLFDIRIYHKECSSLIKNGYKVSLIVQHDNSKAISGIEVIPLPKYRNRLFRMFFISFLAFIKALKRRATIYHFHDPELIPIAILLKCLRKKVIYDVHEDYPRQILSKYYISPYLRRIIATIVEIIENWASKKFDAVICVTPFIEKRFINLDCKTFLVQNMPSLSEFVEIRSNINKKEKQVCYIGAIDEIRGILNIIDAVQDLEVKLVLGGHFSNEKVKKLATKRQGWNNVEYLGFINREKVKEVLSKSLAGLVLFLPEKNHVNSQPNKLFEYMAAGIPVICSDFPIWKEIVEKNNCGICVNPLNTEEIKNAITYIIQNPIKAKEMGENGRKAVIEKYNWQNEEKKLLEAYKNLIDIDSQI